MQNISTLDLDSVTGGTAGGTTAQATPTTPHTSASSGTSDALLTSLNSISGSIKDLNKNSNQGLFGGNGMLMFGMALALRNRTEVSVNYGNHGHVNYSWRSSW